jgi:chloramphenicol O-acetyltransferase
MKKIPKPKERYFPPAWLSKETIKILNILRGKFGDSQIDQLEILADQYRIYQHASKQIDFVDLKESKSFCDMANKALVQIRNIEKNIKPRGDDEQESTTWNL